MNLTQLAPRIAPDIIWRLLDENAVVVSPGTGEVRVLNPVGTIIWQLLVEENTLQEIEAYLVAHYEVSQECANKDLEQFFVELSERGVLIWDGNLS
ncbi:MAG: PqqD family protein [Candidatus Promineifilaceae bacterium]|nr:PqqD family protein [Candidatus Promineifilaceae bacterium]